MAGFDHESIDVHPVEIDRRQPASELAATFTTVLAPDGAQDHGLPFDQFAQELGRVLSGRPFLAVHLLRVYACHSDPLVPDPDVEAEIDIDIDRIAVDDTHHIGAIEIRRLGRTRFGLCGSREATCKKQK